ncbi:MAG TPA: ABC transporter permease [Pyrinomonadaceae bacterium]|nr:ABC transporter permease [Pyrinomonadaceae bacterium]
MNNLIQNIRYGMRSLLRQPGFTAIAVLTLALGIGANTAIFSVVNAVLLRPLPFPHSEQLVLVRDDLTGQQLPNAGMSVNELFDFQNSGIFDQVSAVWPVDANLTGSDRPERIELLAVSPNYFSLLGASAQLGRVFGAEDQAKGFAEGVVISDGVWRRLFGADPNVLGRKIRADNDLYTIVGVMPPGFRHPGQTLRNEVDVWATAGFSANPFGTPVRGTRMLPGAIGRLKPGLSIQQAQSKIDAQVSELRAQFPNEYPAQAGWQVRLLPAQETLVGNVRSTLLLLLAAVGCVLLIGCVNIANLLLAKSSSRQREMGIRVALGANRRQLIVQLLTESLLLALLGGGLALLSVTWLIKFLLKLVPTNIPRLNEVGFDFRMLGFAFLISLVTGFLFGLFPAIQASRPDILSGLKDGTKGAGAGIRQVRFRNALVVAEFALSLVLLVGAGLLLRSFFRLVNVDPGFDPHNALVARIWLPVPNNPELDPYRPVEKRVAFLREVLRRARSLPGIQYAAIGGSNSVPLISTHNKAPFTIEERPDDNNGPLALVDNVSPDYFSALGVPLIRGRFFAENEDNQQPRVVLIDQTMVERYFPSADPVGKRMKFGARSSKAPWMQIVGIVGNVRTDGFDQPLQPHFYVSNFQGPSYAMAVYLRTTSGPDGLAQPLREQIQAVDPNLPVFGVQKLEDVVSESMANRRFAVQMIGLFGLVALLLAGIGIYGVMSYAVTQRTHEIGIRLALGAQGQDVLKMVVRQGLTLAVIGVGIGLVAAFALSRLISGLLYGVSATDPLTFLIIAGLLTVVALLACYIPARRATKVDPLIALRYE